MPKKNLPAVPPKPALNIPTQASLPPMATPVTVNQISAGVAQAAKLMSEIAAHEAMLEVLRKQLQVLRQSTLPSVMESAGVKSISLPDGVTVEVEDFIAANITKENEPVAFAWLRKNKAGGLIKNDYKFSLAKGQDALAKEVAKFVDALNKKLKKKGEKPIVLTRKAAVNWQTLQAFVKEKLQAGKALPPEINVTKVPTAVITFPKEQ